MVRVMDATQDPLTLSWLAIGVALAAAVFTGWQAFTAHQTRRDTLRVNLSITYSPYGNGFTPILNWSVRNTGRGDAADVKVKITYSYLDVRKNFQGQVNGVITGLATERLTFETPPPSPASPIRGDDTRTVGDSLTAVAEYSKPGSKRRKSVQVLVVREA